MMPNVPSKHDWIEDWQYDNGQYMCKCHQCEATFIGHKRRPVCKQCHLDSRRIVCAANRLYFNPDSEIEQLIICGARHNDSLMISQKQHLDDYVLSQIIGEEQGFVDQYGTFHTREDAHKIATKQDQFFRRCGGDEIRLYSENLY